MFGPNFKRFLLYGLPAITTGVIAWQPAAAQISMTFFAFATIGAQTLLRNHAFRRRFGLELFPVRGEQPLSLARMRQREMYKQGKIVNVEKKTEVKRKSFMDNVREQTNKQKPAEKEVDKIRGEKYMKRVREYDERARKERSV